MKNTISNNMINKNYIKIVDNNYFNNLEINNNYNNLENIINENQNNKTNFSIQNNIYKNNLDILRENSFNQTSFFSNSPYDSNINTINEIETISNFNMNSNNNKIKIFNHNKLTYSNYANTDYIYLNKNDLYHKSLENKLDTNNLSIK